MTGLQVVWHRAGAVFVFGLGWFCIFSGLAWWIYRGWKKIWCRIQPACVRVGQCETEIGLQSSCGFVLYFSIMTGGGGARNKPDRARWIQPGCGPAITTGEL